MADLVAATVLAMPPPSYGVPVIRAANSAERSPAKTRWLWESTKPGMRVRPPRSICRSAAGACAAFPIQATRPSWTTTAASGRIPSRSSVLSSQVTSSAMPVIGGAASRFLQVGQAGGQQCGDAAEPVHSVGDHVVDRR